jgi:hypothetical protein
MISREKWTSEHFLVGGRTTAAARKPRAIISGECYSLQAPVLRRDGVACASTPSRESNVIRRRTTRLTCAVEPSGSVPAAIANPRQCAIPLR